jgi:peptide/nickel transport system permease protein
MINGSHLRSGWHFLRDYALGRIAVCIGTILGAGLLCVTLLEIAPGDPIDLLPNSADVRIQLEGEWGLAGSSLDRIFGFMKRLCLGDLGMSLSYRPGQPVGALLWGPGLQSLGLLLGALALSIATGLGLGFSSALSLFSYSPIYVFL